MDLAGFTNHRVGKVRSESPGPTSKLKEGHFRPAGLSQPVLVIFPEVQDPAFAFVAFQMALLCPYLQPVKVFLKSCTKHAGRQEILEERALLKQKSRWKEVKNNTAGLENQVYVIGQKEIAAILKNSREEGKEKSQNGSNVSFMHKKYV